MRRLLIALLVVPLAANAMPSAADATCQKTIHSPLRLDGTSVETRSGGAWSSGEPVTLLFNVSSESGETTFPATALAIVMRTDDQRTKCIDVPLKLARSDGSSATYAGVFYPFRAATYTAEVRIGEALLDARFEVARPAAAVAPLVQAPAPAAAQPPAAQLPAAAAAPGTLPGTDGRVVGLGILAVALLAIAMVGARRRGRATGATA